MIEQKSAINDLHIKRCRSNLSTNMQKTGRVYLSYFSKYEHLVYGILWGHPVLLNYLIDRFLSSLTV